MLETIGYD